MSDYAWVCARCRSVNHAGAYRCYSCDQSRRELDLAQAYVDPDSHTLPPTTGTRPYTPGRRDASDYSCPNCGTPLDLPTTSRLNLSALLVGAIVLLACVGLAGVVLLSSGGLLGALSAASPRPDDRSLGSNATPGSSTAPVTQAPPLRPAPTPFGAVPAAGGNVPEFLLYSKDVFDTRSLLTTQRLARIDRANWKGVQRLIDEERELAHQALDWLDARPPADCYADIHAMFQAQMMLSLKGLEAEEAWIGDPLNGGLEQRVSNLRDELLTMAEDYRRALLEPRCW